MKEGRLIVNAQHSNKKEWSRFMITVMYHIILNEFKKNLFNSVLCTLIQIIYDSLQFYFEESI